MFGVNAHFQLARQNSGGTAVTNMTSFHPIPFVSETLETNINPLVSDTLRGRFDEGPVRQGLLTVQGDVVLRPQPRFIPAFFYGVTGTISSTNLGSGHQHFFVPVQTQWGDDLALPPWTAEIYKDGQNAYQFTDVQISRLAMEVTGGQLVRFTAGLLARVSSEKSATTPTPPDENEFTWNQASVSLGGTGWPNFESLTLTIDNALESVALLDGSLNARRIVRNNYRMLRATGTVDIPVNSITGLFGDFRNGTERTLVLTVEGSQISSGVNYRYKVDVPRFRYDTWRVNVGGPGRVTATFDGRALFSTGSNMLFLLSCQNSFSITY